MTTAGKTLDELIAAARSGEPADQKRVTPRRKWSPRSSAPSCSMLKSSRIAAGAAPAPATITDKQAEQLARIDVNVAKLAWLAAAKRIAEQNAKINQLQAKFGGPPKIDPATPSGQRPIYTKPPAPKRKGKPGAKPGNGPVVSAFSRKGGTGCWNGG